MNQTPCPESVEELWAQAETLFVDLKTALAEIDEMWAEISSLFGVVAPQDGYPPEMVADYLMGSVQQLTYMQRAAPLLLVLNQMIGRDRAKQVPAKTKALREAGAKINQEFASKVFERETIEAFLSFYKTVDSYPCDLRALQATAIIVAYRPMFYIRDAFAGYLHRSRPSEEVFDLLLKLATDAALDALGPFMAAVKSIAEASHKHAEGRYEEFQAGISHEVLKYRLKTAVEEGLEAISETELLLAQLKTREEELDRKFDYAAERVTEVLKFLSKER